MRDRRAPLIDLAALAHNCAIARRHAGARDVIAVVKADAYGHGARRRRAAPACARAARRFAVATVAELAALRAARIDAPVLLLGGVHDAADARAALALGATPVLHHEGDARRGRGRRGVARPPRGGARRGRYGDAAARRSGRRSRRR